MDKVRVPSSIEEAVKQLEGLEVLLVAKEWERAAIVYAFTDDSEGGPTSISAVAAMGIRGLQSRNTVRKYRDAWQFAVDTGAAERVGPGDMVTLPDLGWPPVDTDEERGRKRISPTTPIEEAMDHVVGIYGAEAVVENLAETAPEAIIQTVADHPVELFDKAEKRVARVEIPPMPKPGMAAEHVSADIGELFSHAVSDVDDARKMLEEAIAEGVRFNDLEFAALDGADQRLLEKLEPVLELYRKTVSMVQLEEVRS